MCLFSRRQGPVTVYYDYVLVLDRPIDRIKRQREPTKKRRIRAEFCGSPAADLFFPLGCPWLVHRKQHTREENSAGQLQGGSDPGPGLFFSVLVFYSHKD